MSQTKQQIIMAAHRHHDGIWPRYLTSGIMDFQGVKIFQGEFNRLAKQLNGRIIKKTTKMEQQYDNWLNSNK